MKQALPKNTAPLKSSASALNKNQKRDSERPLVEDIRLLGRILGDVIRVQEGSEAYELVEQIRKLSVAFRRDADHEADKALKKLLKSLPGDRAVSVIRAFTYFSHLANLAEDRHHIRRRAIHERAGHTQEGSIDVALQRLRWAGITPKSISDMLATSYVSPVLTAHPTEVQRKSILDAERDIAHLLTERDAIKARSAAVNAAKDALTPKELAANELQMRARVMQLWQTRLLRFTKLTVADEIENALSYYEATFLREIPKLYAELEHALPGQPHGQRQGRDRERQAQRLHQFIALQTQRLQVRHRRNHEHAGGRSDDPGDQSAQRTEPRLMPRIDLQRRQQQPAQRIQQQRRAQPPHHPMPGVDPQPRLPAMPMAMTVDYFASPDCSGVRPKPDWKNTARMKNSPGIPAKNTVTVVRPSMNRPLAISREGNSSVRPRRSRAGPGAGVLTRSRRSWRPSSPPSAPRPISTRPPASTAGRACVPASTACR